MKKILLFDADGTLFDFHAAEHDALHELMDFYHIQDKETALNTYHRINSALWKRIEEGTMTQSRLKIQRFEEFIEEMHLEAHAEEMAEVFMDKLSQGTHLIDYAYETLEKLHKNYDCHIITNGIARIQKERMSRSELRHFLKELFISEEMGVSKPDTRYFDFVKKKLKPEHDDVLIVIGDSLTSDIQGALQSNLKSIWYNPNHQKKPEWPIDAVIDDLRQLLETIAKL